MQPAIDYDNYVNFDSMLAFYEENKAKIHMNEHSQHPINYEGFAEWKAHLSDLHNISLRRNEITTYLKFAEVLEHSLRYITFPEYMSVVEKIANEMIELIKANKTVCFVLGENIEKSNCWVSLLFFDIIVKKMPKEELQDKLFFFGTKRIHSIVKLSLQRTGPTVIISCDDMTYTGSQIVEKEFLEETFRCKAPCPKDEYRGIPHYVAVPYTTSIAKQKIISPPRMGMNAKFFENTVVLPTFKEQVEEYYKDEPGVIRQINLICEEKESSIKKSRRKNYLNTKRGHNAFGCIFGLGQSAVYFDHKLADWVSVMQQLLAKGSYPPNISYNNVKAKFNNGEKIEPRNALPLIKGCVTLEYGPELCYKAFYKQIQYTYFGHAIKGPNADIITLLKNASARKSVKRTRKNNNKNNKNKLNSV
jgi:hypothetical protein